MKIVKEFFFYDEKYSTIGVASIEYWNDFYWGNEDNESLTHATDVYIIYKDLSKTYLKPLYDTTII